MIEEEVKSLSSDNYKLSIEIQQIGSTAAHSLLNEHIAFLAMVIFKKNNLIHNPDYGLDYIMKNTTCNKFDHTTWFSGFKKTFKKYLSEEILDE